MGKAGGVREAVRSVRVACGIFLTELAGGCAPPSDHGARSDAAERERRWVSGSRNRVRPPFGIAIAPGRLASIASAHALRRRRDLARRAGEPAEPGRGSSRRDSRRDQGRGSASRKRCGSACFAPREIGGSAFAAGVRIRQAALPHKTLIRIRGARATTGAVHGAGSLRSAPVRFERRSARGSKKIGNSRKGIDAPIRSL